MKRYTKKSIKVLAVILILWLIIGITDRVCVANGNKPLFCLNKSSYSYKGNDYGTYYGLGYSFVIMQHPVSGDTEYCYSILGIEVYNDFMN